MSKVYVISDCHFGHKNILNFRKEFSSVDDHDNLIIENILTTTTKRDTLFMLGDMFFNHDVLMKYGSIISDHVGYTHLILGNHDTDNNKRASNVRDMCAMFDSVHGIKAKNKAWLTHAPIHPDELRGKINIHGHVHSQTVQDFRYFNACCENIEYKPVGFQDIMGGYRGVLYTGENK